METSSKNQTLKLFIAIFLVSFALNAFTQVNSKKPVIKDGGQITFLYSTIYSYKNNLLTEISNSEGIDLARSNNNNRTLKLAPGEFIKVKGIDGREKLFNGSIIIKFKEPEDLQSFSLTNEIVLIKNLPNINRGVFKVDNIFNFNKKLNQLKIDNPNIELIELNTVDTSIRPK